MSWAVEASQSGGFRPSGRLRNALRADLVMTAPDRSLDHILTNPVGDEYAWTEDLGRQLKINADRGCVHDTLLYILPELGILLEGDWPPPATPEDFHQLVQATTSSLSGLEVYEHLISMPTDWQHATRVKDCSVNRLEHEMKEILKRRLAAELSRVVGTWAVWDVRKLYERRQAAFDEKRKQEELERSGVKVVRTSGKRRPTPVEIAQRRADNPSKPFIPPARI
jgi:hypothetical protein